MRDAFDLFDKDGDQYIGPKELYVVMQAIGRNMSIDEIKESMIELKKSYGYDADELAEEEDVELTMDEFLDYIAKEINDNNTEELVEAFQTFGPVDQRQGISRQQLRKTMEEFGEKFQDNHEFDALFEDCDRDGNGEIGFEDFLRVLMSK